MTSKLQRYLSPERRLVLKLDIFMLVWAFITGLTKDMDQSNTTQAYVSGMKEALSLNGNELVEFTTFYSIGYALAIVPSQLLLTKIRPSMWLPFCEVLWGVFTLATYAAPNAKVIFALRFLTGLAEASAWPGLVTLLLNWYTPSEVGKRVAIFGVSGVAGNMFLGILQAALYKNLDGHHGLEGWQWLFIVTGIITVVWGIIGVVAIPDSPVNSRVFYLSKEEKALAEERMERAGRTIARHITLKDLKRKTLATYAHPITWLFSIAYLQFAWSQRANSYFLLFLKGLKNADGTQRYSTYTVNLLPLGGYAISIVANIGFNALSDWKQWRWQLSIFVATIQVVALIPLVVWPSGYKVQFAFYYFTYATAAWGYCLVSWISDIYRREPEARAITIGTVVTLVYVGHATIPLRVWRVSDSPKYPIGFPLSLAFAVGSIIAIAALQYYVHRHKDILDKSFLGGWSEPEVNEKNDLESKRESTKSVDSSSTDLVKETPSSR